MGLDAHVLCDCYEKGRCKPAPRPELVDVDEQGMRYCRSDDLDVQMEFDGWNESACEHPNGVMLHHRLGNVSHVAMLRGVVARSQGPFPILLGGVLNSGSHAGDRVPRRLLEDLRDELRRLEHLDVAGDEKAALAAFRAQMSELVDCALRLNRPLEF